MNNTTQHKQETHNGYTNYSTWLLALNITNDPYTAELFDEKVNKNHISLSDFIKVCVHCEPYFDDGDNIDYSEINFREVYDDLKDEGDEQ